MSKGLLLAAAAAGPAPPALQQLFASDRSKHSWSRGKYICYRNPSLVAANGALLAFASGVNAGGCDDSVVSVPGSSTLYYSHPDAASRVNMSVHVSQNDAQSWRPAVDVCHGGSAYSSLQVLDHAGCTLGLIFDKDVGVDANHSVAFGRISVCDGDQRRPLKTDEVGRSSDGPTSSAPLHLKFMGYSDRYAADPTLPAPSVTSAHANLYTHRNLSKIVARFRDDGLPGLIMLMESEWWTGMRQGKGKSASPLLPGWEAHLDAFAKAVTKAPAGSVRGVQLGDELVCMGLPLANLSAIAAHLRPLLQKDIWIYTNECFVHSHNRPSHACDPAKNGTDCAVKNKGTQIPGVHNECRAGYCADRVWSAIPPEIDYVSLDNYCRDDKYCNVSADVAAAEAQHYLMPLLQPHQRLWAVPGLFGPASARGAAARAAYDALLVEKLEGWLQIIRGDARWVGLMGWHWPSMNTISAEYALGAAAFPKLQAALAQTKPPPLPPLKTEDKAATPATSTRAKHDDEAPSKHGRRYLDTESDHSAAPIDFTAVFTAGEKDEHNFAVNSFRIPGFVVANTTLVVAAEARLYSHADLSPHHLVVKRSLTNGRTWLPLQTVVAPTMFEDGTSGVHGDVYYDPTPVFDAARSTIHLIFAYQPARYINWTTCTRGDHATGPSTLGHYLGCSEVDTTNPRGAQLFSVSSADLEKTWTTPRNLSAAYDATSRKWCGMSGAGGGNGIQLRSGRLVVPGYHGGCECRGGKGVLGISCLQSHVLLADTSTDGHPDWRLSTEFFPGSAEGSVAELPPSATKNSRTATAETGGDLVYIARLERTETRCVPSAAHCAGTMFSTSGGSTWHGEVDNGQLLDPRCKNTVATAHAADGKQILVHTGAASAIVGQRVNITLLFSRDAKEWSNPISLHPQTNAAGDKQIGGSAVQGLPHSEVGVVLQAQRPPKYHLSILFTRVAVTSLKLDDDDDGVTCSARFDKFPSAAAPHADLIINNDSKAFDSYNLMSPFVAQMDTGVWHMYYGAGPATDPKYLRYQLGLATAPTVDGPWTRHGKPILDLGLVDNFETTPSLLRDENNAALRDNGLLHMVFPGNRNQTMYHATSHDGVAWEMDPTPIFRGYAPSVLRVNSLLHMYYINTWQTAPALWRVELATGRDWRSLKFAGVVLHASTQPWERGNLFYPYIVYNKQAAKPWMLWWSSYANRTTCLLPSHGPYITAIGVAFGHDGLNFEKCPSNPLLVPTNASVYDSVYVGSPCLVTANASGTPIGPRLYYAGRVDHDHKYYSLAHATLKSDDSTAATAAHRLCGGSTPLVSTARTWSLGGGDESALQLSGLRVRSSSVHVFWSHLPVLPAIATLTVCVPTGCESEQLVALNEEVADDTKFTVVAVVAVSASWTERCPVVVHVQASIDRLGGLRVASVIAYHSDVTECSDGVDNDGDGLIDAVDPGCQTSTGREDDDNTAPTSLSWEWGSDPDGDYLQELRWSNAATGTTVPIVRDEPSAKIQNGCRWFSHGGNCSHWVQPYGNNSARQIQDWAWKIVVPDGHGGGPQHLEQESAITKRLVSSNSTSAVFESYSKRLRLRDVYSLRGDTLFISINATNLMSDAVRATFLTQFGSIQLDAPMWHLGNKRLGSLDRNWSFVEACCYPYDGLAPMPSRACTSAASAMGDSSHFSVGIQCLTPIPPDGTDALLAYMDVPANPRTPTSTTTLTLALQPGETRTFVLAMKIAAPAGVGLDRPAVLKSMESVVDPYVSMFHSVFGKTPQYCPTPSTSYEDAINYGLNRHPVCSKRYPLNNPISKMQNCNPHGSDTTCDCWWANGTRMYDVFNIDKLSRGSVLREFGAPVHISWRPGVQSSHLTTPALFEQCEFNPNADVMDPHQDVFWNVSIWANMSDAAQTAGFSLGWGLRSTEEILTPDNKSASIVMDPTQPNGYKINSGMCVNFEGFFGDEIGNASSPDSDGRGVRWGNLLGPQTDRLVARFKTLTMRGVRGFYLDSHIAPGRFEAVLKMRRAFPGLGKQLQIFRESTNDVDLLAMGLMPWYAYGDVVNEHGEASSPAWQPIFVADHSHWARMLVPDGEVVFGQIADPPPSCHNTSTWSDPLLGPIADLSQHRGNTFILATISMLPKIDASEQLRAGVCAVMTKSWDNYVKRMASYGRAMGCKEFPRPTCQLPPAKTDDDSGQVLQPPLPVRPFVGNMSDEAGKKYACFRIPALLRVGTTLLLFAEGRAGTPGFGFVCRDHGDIRIVLRRSTSEGATWGPILTAAAEPDHICWKFPGPPLETCSIGQPTPILDESTGVVHLLFARDNKQNFVSTSSNAGLTWSTRVNITATTKPNPYPNAFVAPGPQKGVQLKSGRLIAGSYYQKNQSWGESPFSFSYSIYSDGA